MPKKNSRKNRPAPAARSFDAAAPCPCGLGKSYAECCGAFHAGTAAPTAEALMRSRFTAYVLHDVPYLMLSWHSSTRPSSIDLDDTDLSWTRLEVLATTDGGPFHNEGTVEFAAHYREAGRPGILREHSAFVREGGRWVYVNPVQPPA